MPSQLRCLVLAPSHAQKICEGKGLTLGLCHPRETPAQAEAASSLYQPLPWETARHHSSVSSRPKMPPSNSSWPTNLWNGHPLHYSLDLHADFPSHG